MALKENYKDDILDVSVNTKRKYRMTENADGTVSFDDETVYTQEGDSFGASDLNAMAHAINNTSSDAEHTSYDNTESGLISDNVQGAIDEVVEEFEQTPITVGGETLSTIDDKLNFIIEGMPLTKISDYDIWSTRYNYQSSNPVAYTAPQKIVMVFASCKAGAGNSVGNKEGVNNYDTSRCELVVTDDYNFTIKVANGDYANICVLMEKASS